MAKKKKEIKVKEPVRIREKVLGDGTISLYLDMYHKGNRKKEGLKLYIIPETTPAAKLQNKNTRRLAEQIKAQRILDIQKDGLVDWDNLQKTLKTNETCLPLKQTSVGPFFKSTLAEIYFIIYSPGEAIRGNEAHRERDGRDDRHLHHPGLAEELLRTVLRGDALL